VLTLTPSPVAFGNQNVGTTSTPIAVTIKNTGNAQETLGNPSFSITGANASDFATTGGSCTIGQVLNPGDSCVTNFAFTPSAAGARSATQTVLGTVNGTDSFNGNRRRFQLGPLANAKSDRLRQSNRQHHQFSHHGDREQYRNWPGDAFHSLFHNHWIESV
jgi:hypothetical protein